MAELVLALASSHSPMLNNDAEEYPSHGERDRTVRKLLDKDGRPVDYDTLLAAADPAIARQLEPEIVAGRVENCRRDIARLSEILAAARLDAVIVVGDDQHEQFLDDNLPAISVYRGETIENWPSPVSRDT